MTPISFASNVKLTQAVVCAPAMVFAKLTTAGVGVKVGIGVGMDVGKAVGAVVMTAAAGVVVRSRRWLADRGFLSGYACDYTNRCRCAICLIHACVLVSATVGVPFVTR